MSLIGCILLLSGWVLAVAALVLLPGLGQRYAFVLAGLLVEVLGFGLMSRSYMMLQKGKR